MHQQASEEMISIRRRVCSAEPRRGTGLRRSVPHTAHHGTMTISNSIDRSTILVWCLMSLIGVCFFQHGNGNGNNSGCGVTLAHALTSSSPFVRHVSMRTSITRAATATVTTSATADRRNVEMNAKSSASSSANALPASSDLPAASVTATANSAGWRVALDIGREPFSTMPSSWAKSGSRFPLIVKFEFASNNDNKDNGNTVSSISGDARYTASQGEIVVPIEPGTWTLSDSDDDQKKDLSFSFNLPQTIERNGVQIGPCTVTCQTVLYSTKDIDALNREFYRVRAITDEVNAQLQEMKRKKEAPKKWDFENSKWVQRYENESILGTFSKSMKQFKAERQERDRSKVRPKPSDLSLESGAFPGIDCNVYIGKRGTIRMYGYGDGDGNRSGNGNGGGFFGGDRGGIIGTFGAEPINDNPASYYRPSY